MLQCIQYCWQYIYPSKDVIEMGNTHLEPETKSKLRAYMKETDCRTISRGVDSLLAEHRELLAIKRENELLHRLFEPYKLDEEDD